MRRLRLVAGAALFGACLVAPAARAQNQPPAPPGANPPGTVLGRPALGTVPGTTTRGATSAPAPPMALPGVRTVMVFPFENNAKPDPQSTVDLRALAVALSDAVERGMDASGAYSTVPFRKDPLSLLLQRAQSENPTVMSDAINNVIDPVKGTVDQARAMQIAARTGMQALMLGSIEDYKYDKAANRVEIVATAQILNPITGEPLRTAGVTGSATGGAGADERTVAQAAATDVAKRTLAGLSVPPPPPPGPNKHHTPRKVKTQEQEGTGRKFPGWIPAGLLLGIIAATVK